MSLQSLFSYLIFLTLSYLIGSLPFSQWIALSKGCDLRKVGSGNVGATNVYRVLGLRYAVFAGLLDAMKGFLPVFSARFIFFPNSEIFAILVGFAAMFGHISSPFMNFKGGKGVATGAGAFLGLDPGALTVGFIVWFMTLKGTKIMSLASIFGASSVLIYEILIGSIYLKVVSLIAFLIILYRHRDNIKRLLRGEELRLK
ncbi:Glycerol-3-phosphate acyltransferase [Thermodesulfobium narugense DSM 14796]|uniref:Glycerol-3-phosphate acyltransferase n=1 Tax=Thermodesulfobium narugense DSM 14796 TaxID=747365 RepID=M1E4U8_9BACT|nr:glycerol-3-phosphate 1-O-acyltransferase PlsY [Thermodesulfobium narugense]AEE13776.1 Glycerol-3-phosphate acyltransferase [Thermodesulfobium narugense DSM 14796]